MTTFLLIVLAISIVMNGVQHIAIKAATAELAEINTRLQRLLERLRAESGDKS